MAFTQRPTLAAHLAALRAAINSLEQKLEYMDDSPIANDSASASLGNLQTHPFWTTTLAAVDALLTTISNERTAIVTIRNALAVKFGLS
jgi:hypothetical protein